MVAIIDPSPRNPSCAGTTTDAVDAMVAFAAMMRRRHGDNAQPITARHLVNGQTGRVAEIGAAVLLCLADERLLAAMASASADPQDAALVDANDQLGQALIAARAQLAEAVEELRVQRGRHCPCCTRADRTEREG